MFLTKPTGLFYKKKTTHQHCQFHGRNTQDFINSIQPNWCCLVKQRHKLSQSALTNWAIAAKTRGKKKADWQAVDTSFMGNFYRCVRGHLKDSVPRSPPQFSLQPCSASLYTLCLLNTQTKIRTTTPRENYETTGRHNKVQRSSTHLTGKVMTAKPSATKKQQTGDNDFGIASSEW